jgi:hypothetical protein
MAGSGGLLLLLEHIRERMQAKPEQAVEEGYNISGSGGRLERAGSGGMLEQSMLRRQARTEQACTVQSRQDQNIYRKVE